MIQDCDTSADDTYQLPLTMMIALQPLGRLSL